MSEEMSVLRKLATIRTISKISPIEGADRIETLGIDGWSVVSKKGEFNVGDKCLFFEIDSLLNYKPWNSFLWKDDKDTTKSIRLKTVKLRKQVSQGLAVPVSVLEEYRGSIENFDEMIKTDGSDFSNVLGITKYEPDIPAQLAGRVRGNFPSFLIKTDVERIQNCMGVIHELRNKEIEVYATIKEDGTSFTAYNFPRETVEPDKYFGVCSRTLDLTETEENVYWQMARKYDLRNKLPLITKPICVQAECRGMGIQKNKMGAKDVDLRVFDVFDIKERKYLGLDEIKVTCDILGLPMVRVIFRGKFTFNSIDELIEFSNQQKYENGEIAEGVVWRTVNEVQLESMRGRASFKVISTNFLLKHGE